MAPGEEKNQRYSFFPAGPMNPGLLTPELTVDAYRHFAPYVQRCLADSGVRTADLPDLCHEVFLIVHAKSESLAGIVHFDLWLREICRRVAAGYRRRSVYRREVLSSEPQPDTEAQLVDPADTLGQDERVRRALLELDEESRELLALHDVGDLPLAELARLTMRDRKTVRKKLQLARRKLLTRLRETELSPSHGEHVEEPAISRGPPAQSAFEVLTVTRDVRIGQIGNVAITHWPNVPSAEAFDQLLYHAPRVIEQGGGTFAYLAIVDVMSARPNAIARRKIVECLERFGPRLLQYATVVGGSGSWLVQPVMSGLMVLARPRFPMRFFTSLQQAVSWLCAGAALGSEGALAPAELIAAAEQLTAFSHEEVSGAATT